jgi:hypothetical protein
MSHLSAQEIQILLAVIVVIICICVGGLIFGMAYFSTEERTRRACDKRRIDAAKSRSKRLAELEARDARASADYPETFRSIHAAADKNRGR